MLLEKSSHKKNQDSQSWKLPCSTQSICPVCMQVLNAEIFESENKVWMKKNCPEHGEYNELLSTDKDFFLKRRRTHYEMPSGIDNPSTTIQKGCPEDCGHCPQHLSTPCMVNIDLTNRCNMNCPICFANANATGHVLELNMEQLEMMLDKAMNIKPHPPISIQFAGGEPTIHPNFLDALKMAKDKGVLDLQVASNGIRFAKDPDFTEKAAQSGLDVVYLQFDGLTDDIYEQSRGRPMIETKKKAIENLRKSGIMVALVPTIVKGLNDHQVGEILNFAIENTDVITGVSYQPVSLTGRIDESKRHEMRYTMADMARDIQDQTNSLDMHRDWYPYSIINPISRLLEALTEKPKMRFSCNAHCGAATYLLVDKVKNEAIPFTRFIDIESAMQELDKEAEAIENHSSWRKKISKFQVSRKLKKHFYPDKAPDGLDFEKLLSFINTMAEADPDETKKQRGHYYHQIGERFNVLLIAAMHFQDNYNFEIPRVQRCVVHYAAPDGNFYPFCTWNSGPCHRYRIEEQFSVPSKKSDKNFN